MKSLVPLLLLCLLASADVCRLDVAVSNEGSLPIIDISFDLDKGAYIYSESIAVVFPDGIAADKLQAPPADLQELKGTFLFRYAVPQQPFNFTVRYQACAEGVCYMPATADFAFDGNANVARLDSEDAPSVSSETALDNFAVSATATGYQSAAKFLQLCEITEKGFVQDSSNLLEKVFDKFGFLFALLLLIPLGALLNCTPCVLPMIPINLAIIGTDSGSRTSVFHRSTVYALGMMLTYGALGVATVLTGSLFDVFSIDLSRWRGRGNATTSLGVFIMGGVTAILSSACVAPVLIWAIVLATSLYSQGLRHALLLPFFLGLGMALPWPLLALGLTRLPKPGRWMIRVRQAFAILIALFALYYIVIGIKLMDKGSISRENWRSSLEEAIAEAKRDSKPIVIEFTGKSCKACQAMDKTTFRNKDVIDALDHFAKLEVNIDDKSTDNAALVARFKIVGAPSFVFLKTNE